MLFNYIKSFKEKNEPNKPKELYDSIYKQHQMCELNKALTKNEVSSSEMPRKLKITENEEPSDQPSKKKLKVESKDDEPLQNSNTDPAASSLSETKRAKITDFFKRL
jgi:hypothetical protein